MDTALIKDFSTAAATQKNTGTFAAAAAGFNTAPYTDY